MAFNSTQITHNVLSSSWSPLVSVILPVYQGENTILRAVRSVLSQTYKNLELIVVDDGSTDRTQEQLSQIDDPRLNVIPKENAGVAIARNTGFQQAKGQYIAFIDADDQWLPKKVQTELQIIEVHNKVPCIIYSSYYGVDKESRLVHLPPIFKDSGNLRKTVIDFEGIFLPSTSLVHREVYESTGGFLPDCYHEDRAFFILACQKYPAFPTKERLVLYQQTADGRNRRILQDYSLALESELSIVKTLSSKLSFPEIDTLKQNQLRFLFNRFMMYNSISCAKKMWSDPELTDTWKKNLSKDKKGALSLLSFRLKINFLYYLRLFIQLTWKYIYSPWWKHQHLLCKVH